MEPISLILTALVAGATGGALDALKDEVKERAKALSEKVRGLAHKRVAGNPVAETALAQYQSNPDVWKAPLADELTKAGAANDTELLNAAAELLKLIDQAGGKGKTYNVTISGGQGVQVGEGNTQANIFYPR